MADTNLPPIPPRAERSPDDGSSDGAGGSMLIDIEQELRRSYLGYAVSTLISRALPDVRDGFKPVQRRILATMRDLGLGPGSARVKSAQVVGTCFVEGTLVSTPKGLLPIEDLQIGDEVYTQNGVCPITQTYIMPRQSLLEVELASGMKNVCTVDQKFKVLTPELQVAWKQANELTPGEYIISRSAASQIADYIDVDGVTLNEDIAYLLGFFLADDWVCRDARRGYDRIGFSCGSLEIIQKLQTILLEQFGEKSNITDKAGLHCLRINNSKLNNQLLNAFGIRGKYAHNIAIPEAVFRSPKSVAWAFLSGFVDGDGSINKEDNTLVFTSISETFIRQTQVLLHSLNIHSHLYTYAPVEGRVGDKPVYGRYANHVLEVYSLSFQRAAEHLDLAHAEKRRRLHSHATTNRFTAERGQHIPYLGQKIIAEFQAKHLGGGWYMGASGQKVRAGLKHENGVKLRCHKDLAQTFEVYFSTLVKLNIRNKLQAIGSDYAHFVQQLTESGITFSQVKAIRDAGEDVTYDIQVARDHEFVANGMLVHNCMGSYHPHGDSAIYGTMVRMAQDFSLRYPLVDPQGNWGSVDGDPPAAYRYTECRMTPLAVEMLEDIERETVDYMPNYDQSKREPIVLPGKFPNFLCNGGEGIAVGMSTSMPPHNLREVVDAHLYLLDHPEATPDDLMKFIPAPDFPTAALILGTKGAKEAYRTGRGRVIMQAQLQIEPMDGGKNAIVVTELPYQVNKAMLVKTIAGLAKEKKIDGITDVNDFSDKHGMRMVIELRRDVLPKRIVNYLLKHTALRQTFGIIMLALVNGQPKMLNLAQIINLHVAHRKEVIARRTRYELQRAKQAAHIREGLQIALNFLDEIIALIRRAANSETARTEMVARFGLTQIQAEAILNMQLRQIAQLEAQKIEDEYKNLLKEIARLEDILVTPARVVKLIKDELKALRDKYGDERRTRILPLEADEITEEDLVPEEQTLVTISRDGYIKRVPMDTYRTQKRGGRGVAAANLKDEDSLAHLFVATTTHYILFFTNRGRVYRLKAYEVAATSRQARGQHINNLIQLEPGDQITAILPMKNMQGDGFLLMATEYGEIKRTSLSEFANLRANGLNCFDLETGDNLNWVKHTDGLQDVVLVTRKGMSIRFAEADTPTRGRAAGGVRGIEMRAPGTRDLDDNVVTMDVIAPDTRQQLLVVSENGLGKRTDLSKYTRQGRGGRGLKTMDVTTKTGPVIAAAIVHEDDKLMIISEKGVTIQTTIREIKETQSRKTQGVILMNLNTGDKVVTIERLVDTDEVEQEVIAAAQTGNELQQVLIEPAETDNGKDGSNDAPKNGKKTK